MSANVQKVITDILSEIKEGTAFDVHEKLPEYMRKIPVGELDKILTEMNIVMCVGIKPFKMSSGFKLGKNTDLEVTITRNAIKWKNAQEELEKIKAYDKDLKEFFKDQWFKPIMEWDKENLGPPVGWHPDSCKCYGCYGGDVNKAILMFSPFEGICVRYIGKHGKKKWDVVYNFEDQILKDKYGTELNKFPEDHGKKLSRPSIEQLLYEYFEKKLKYFDGPHSQEYDKFCKEHKMFC